MKITSTEDHYYSVLKHSKNMFNPLNPLQQLKKREEFLNSISTNSELESINKNFDLFALYDTVIRRGL